MNPYFRCPVIRSHLVPPRIGGGGLFPVRGAPVRHHRKQPSPTGSTHQIQIASNHRKSKNVIEEAGNQSDRRQPDPRSPSSTALHQSVLNRERSSQQSQRPARQPMTTPGPSIPRNERRAQHAGRNARRVGA
jgi:hypothetical protein